LKYDNLGKDPNYNITRITLYKVRIIHIMQSPVIIECDSRQGSRHKRFGSS